MKTILAFLLLGTVALGGATFAAKSVSADYYGDSSLIQRLVERFGLNQDEVNSVIDEYQTERQQEFRNRMEERLNQAVTDGVITEEQKQSLIERKNQMRQQHQQQREEFQSWAQEQGIDLEKLAPYYGSGKGFGGHFRHHGMME